MRKTRLVILPTKCLHQMGFLLLFLSCPVIGDWGRIRPESEDSHNAIQIDREGTCSFERDPPGGLVDFLDENGSKQCRSSEELDSNIPAKPFKRIIQTTKSDESVDIRKMNYRENEGMLERRMLNEKGVRNMIQRKMTDERKIAGRTVQRNARNDVRSRSVESGRSSGNRNDVRTRSLSLSRLENERTVRQNNKRNLRRDSERLHLTRRRSERQNERKTEQQRRFTKEASNERRDNERTIRAASGRRERETVRLTRSAEHERQSIQRENNRRSIQEQSMRSNDVTRRQTQERTQNVRERTERRLSLAHREQNDATRIERFENKREAEQIDLERRVPEIRKTRSWEFERRKSDQRENLVRMSRNFDDRRETDNRRFATLTKASQKNVRERRVDVGMNERLEGMKSRKMAFATLRRNQNDIFQVNLNVKKAGENNFFEGITKWMDLKSYDSYKTGDWTANCVIGAAVYYITTRQIKAL